MWKTLPQHFFGCRKTNIGRLYDGIAECHRRLPWLRCFETNLIHSRNFKTEKYENIKRYSKVTVNKIETFFLEVSSLDFIAKTLKPSGAFLLKSNINCNRLKQQMSQSAVTRLYYIYTHKAKNGIIHSWWNLYYSLANYAHGLHNISVEN